MRPNRLIVATYLRRGTTLWVVKRAALTGLWILAGDDPLHLTFASFIGALVIYVSVGYIETTRRHERDLLGNLGVKRRTLAVFFVVPALVGEGVLRALGSVIG